LDVYRTANVVLTPTGVPHHRHLGAPKSVLLGGFIATAVAPASEATDSFRLQIGGPLAVPLE
jgi:hypothetical protein